MTDELLIYVSVTSYIDDDDEYEYCVKIDSLIPSIRAAYNPKLGDEFDIFYHENDDSLYTTIDYTFPEDTRISFNGQRKVKMFFFFKRTNYMDFRHPFKAHISCLRIGFDMIDSPCTSQQSTIYSTLGDIDGKGRLIITYLPIGHAWEDPEETEDTEDIEEEPPQLIYLDNIIQPIPQFHDNMEQFIDTVPWISGNNDDEDGRSYYTPLQGRCQACESYANNVSYINNYFYTFDNGILYSDGQLAVPLQHYYDNEARIFNYFSRTIDRGLGGLGFIPMPGHCHGIEDLQLSAISRFGFQYLRLDPDLPRWHCLEASIIDTLDVLFLQSTCHQRRYIINSAAVRRLSEQLWFSSNYDLANFVRDVWNDIRRPCDISVLHHQ